MHFTMSSDDGMGWMEFVTSLVGSLAWPVCLLIVALMFREPIAQIIRNIREARWGDGSVTIGQQLDEAEQAGQEVISAIEQQQPNNEFVIEPNPQDRMDDYKFWLRFKPGMAVIEEWAEIETEIRKVGERAGLGPTTLAMSINQIANRLKSMKVLEPNVARWLLEMRQVRNAAAHDQEVTETDALRFLELAAKVRIVLRRLQPDVPSHGS